VKTIVQNAGRAVIGMGIGKGEGGAYDAAKKAILNPLLENNSIDGAEGVLINITGGLSLSLNDVQEATAPVYESAKEDANIMMGAVIDPDLKDEVRVTVIATQFEDSRIMDPAVLLNRKQSKAKPAAPSVSREARRETIIVREPGEGVLEELCSVDEQVTEEHEAVILEEAMAMETIATASKMSEPVASAPGKAALPRQQAKQEEVEFPAFEAFKKTMPEVTASPEPKPEPRSTRRRNIGYKGSERILSKSLSNLTSGSLLNEEDPLDIPTFLRKPVGTRRDR
jgi:hypothetical protein